MPDVPPGMLRNRRPKLKEQFAATDYLYRRVNPDDWDGAGPSISAYSLPDMSVGWSRLGHPAWLRIDEDHLDNDVCRDWAVVGFQVKDIPNDMLHLGVQVWTFDSVHVPKDKNYPHSEVWCYRDREHIIAKRELDADFHLRWRQKLLWNTQVFIQPHEKIACPQDPP
jgi:hypothetical protein